MSKDATPVAESVEVTQADREAAASIIVLAEYQEAVIAGRCDDAPSVLAFARHRLASYEAGRAEGVRAGEQQRREVQAVWRCAFGDVACALDVLKNKWLTSRRKHEREAGSHLAALADAIWANRDPAPTNYNEAAESGKGLHARVKAAFSKEPTK